MTASSLFLKTCIPTGSGQESREHAEVWPSHLGSLSPRKRTGLCSYLIARGLVVFFLYEIPPAPSKPNYISEEGKLGFLH